MPKIINAFRGQDPTAQAIARLGQAWFGDRVGGDIKREKLRGLQRENTETELLGADIAALGGAHNAGADPNIHARTILSGYDPVKLGKLGLLGSAIERGARDLRTQNFQVGTGQPFDNTASAFDAKLGETRRSNDMASADRRYGVDIGAETTRRGQDISSADRRYDVDISSADRRYGVDRTVGQNMFEFQNTPKPALVDNQPRFLPQSALTQPDAFGSMPLPILSDTERKGTLVGEHFGNMGALPTPEQVYLGARGTAAPSAKMYSTPEGREGVTHDGGLTDAHTGAALPQGTRVSTLQGGAGDVGLSPRAQGQLDQSLIEFSYFDVMGKRLRDVATRADPRLFGATGKLLDAARGGITLGTNLWGMFGFNDAEEAKAAVVADIQKELTRQQQSGRTTLSPDVMGLIFSQDSGELETLAGLYVYQAAKAIANQEGRGLSNEDVQRFTRYIGSPQDWSIDKPRYLEKLASVDALARDLIATSRRLRGLPPMDSGAAPTQQPPQDASIPVYDINGQRVR